jgi:hypothetical protein
MSKILRLKDTLTYDRDTDRQNSAAIFAQFLPAFLVGVSDETR